MLVFAEAPLPEILAKTCFSGELSICWVVVVKMAGFQIVHGPF